MTPASFHRDSPTIRDTTASSARTGRDGRRNVGLRSRLQFHVIFSLSFVVFVIAAIANRLKPNFWIGSVPHRSFLIEAWEMSGLTARIAFAG